MKKTYLWSLLAVLMATLMSVGLTSCGDDDPVTPESGEEVEKPEDNLPEKTRAFVGYWRNSQDGSTASCDFLFLPDGTCRRYYTYLGDYIDTGYWTFDETTNILSTTVGGWQWQVTLSNSDAWAGVSLGSVSTHTFSRDDARYAIYLIENTAWQCGDSVFLSLGKAEMGGVYVNPSSNRYSFATKNGTMRFSCNDNAFEAPYKYNKTYSEYSFIGVYVELGDIKFTGANITATYALFHHFSDQKYDGYPYFFYTYNYSPYRYYHYVEYATGTIMVKNYNKSTATLTLSATPEYEYRLVNEE